MEMKVYNTNEIILKQGDAGESMFYVLAGKVGVYLDYGTSSEKELTELCEQQFFGEMSLLNNEVRSATVVALEDDTCLQEISEANFKDFCMEYPEKVFAIMQQLSERLRRATSSKKD